MPNPSPPPRALPESPVSTSRGALEPNRPTLARLGAIRHHRVLIGLIVVMCSTVAVIYALTTPKRYEAQSDLLVTPVADTSNVFLGTNILSDSVTAPQIVGRSLQTLKVTNEVIRRVGLKMTSPELLKKVKVSPIQQSSIVSVRVRGENSELVAKVANEFPAVLIQQHTADFQREIQGAVDRLRVQLRSGTLSPGEAVALEDRLAQLQSFVGASDPTLRILSPAAVPTDAYWPRPVLSVLVAIFAGLILGIGGALLLELAEPRLLDEDELLGRFPILTRVPLARRRIAERYLHGSGSLPADLWEAYRTLRASLSAHGVGEGMPKSVLVTSAIEGEGKTMTATSLAIAMAAGGRRVVLVDGDFRRSMAGEAFGLTAQSKGFASLLSGNGQPEDALVPSPGYGSRLKLLLAGDDQMIDLLEPRRIEHVLNELKGEADVIIVDSPPVTEFADAVALADAVDVVLIAVRLGHSRRDRFDDLVRFFEGHGIVPAGYVVTARRRRAYYDLPARRGEHAIEEWSRSDGSEAPARLAEPGI
jgi:Mrp family chromosome partitioning ATPase/capsular polysaccharide biosynthesis protein